MAGKVTVGLTFHWICSASQTSGLSPYRLTVYSTPTTLLMGYGTLCLFVISSDALQLSASTLQSEISRTVVLASRPL